MVISGEDLHRLVDKIFPKQKPAKIGPASYDLTIADDVVVYDGDLVAEGAGDEISIKEETTFYKGEFVIAHTREYIALPPDIAGLMLLRSSMGRRGWLHAFAGFVDPGFHGELVFELSAATETTLKGGTRIAQLILFSASGSAVYDGGYNGQTGNTLAYEGWDMVP